MNEERVAFKCPSKKASNNNVFIEAVEMYRSYIHLGDTCIAKVEWMDSA